MAKSKKRRNRPSNKVKRYKEYLLNLRSNIRYPYYKQLRADWFDSLEKTLKFLQATGLWVQLEGLDGPLPLNDQGGHKGFKTLLTERIQQGNWPPEGYTLPDKQNTPQEEEHMSDTSELEQEDAELQSASTQEPETEVGGGEEVELEADVQSGAAVSPKPEKVQAEKSSALATEAPSSPSHQEGETRKLGNLGIWHPNAGNGLIWEESEVSDDGSGAPSDTAKKQPMYYVQWDDLAADIQRSLTGMMDRATALERREGKIKPQLPVSFLSLKRSGRDYAVSVKLSEHTPQRRPAHVTQRPTDLPHKESSLYATQAQVLDVSRKLERAIDERCGALIAEFGSVKAAIEGLKTTSSGATKEHVADLRCYVDAEIGKVPERIGEDLGDIMVQLGELREFRTGIKDDFRSLGAAYDTLTRRLNAIEERVEDTSVLLELPDSDYSDYGEAPKTVTDNPTEEEIEVAAEPKAKKVEPLPRIQPKDKEGKKIPPVLAVLGILAALGLAVAAFLAM